MSYDGTCAECLEPIVKADVARHAQLHQVGTDHLLVPLDRERFHEKHGGDEYPEPGTCPVCEDDINTFIRYGV